MKTNTTTGEIRFSLFLSPKGIQETIPLKSINLHELDKFIISDDCTRLSIPVYSCTQDEYPALKSKLPFITPNGVFSQRGQKYIDEFNATILPIDIDKISHDKALTLRNYLSRQTGCIYVSVSPSQKGVKALFLLSKPLPWDTFSDILKINKELIESELALDCFDVGVDTGQWNKAQCMYLGFDDNMFFNANPKPINLPLKIPIIKHVNDSIMIDTPPMGSHANRRVCRYIETSINNIVNDIVNASKGNRHEAIGKVMKVKSILHYAPHLEKYAYEQLKKACASIYPEKPYEGVRCFTNAWERAKDLNNDTLNEIINATK